MKNNNLLLFTWASLAALLLIALPSFFRFAPEFVGKSYVDTPEFKNEMDVFYEVISSATLNPLNVEEAKKKIGVTKTEIDEHRYYYGSESDQLANIYDQYNGRIEEAEEVGNEGLVTSLTKERDQKISDIEKNFESDKHIEEKIKAEKAEALDKFVADIKGTQAAYFPVAYSFTNKETDETFSAGNVNAPAAYKRVFNAKTGFFRANSIPSQNYDTDGFYAGSDAAVSLEVAETVNGITTGDLLTKINSVQTFTGIVVVPKSSLKEGYLKEQVTNYNKRKYSFYILWLFGVLSALALFTVLQFRKEWIVESSFTVTYNNLKVDVKAAIFLLSLYFTTDIIYSNAGPYNLLYNHPNYFVIHLGWYLVLAIAVAFIAFQLVNFVERWKHRGLFEKDFMNSYTIKFFVALQEMFLKKSIGVQTFILLIGFFLAGIGIVVVGLEPAMMIIYIPAVLFLGLPALYLLMRRSAYLNKIIISTEKMAQGSLHEEIKVIGKSPLAEHAANLNNLHEGVRTSLDEQAKSERLKTELVTNVSHDLRTPLTSIITYTDLLKSEDLSTEDRLKYVDILDKKSQRLKTLIEDLFEVSKMASGNLELNKQRVDLTQLLQQALAEHEEEILTSKLDFRVNIPEVAIIAHVDGQRWWRVLDNLILNAIKYSMPGTRVYITLKQADDVAQFELKNISKYELNEKGDELFERFKRADTSRHTEGSGLGLAIAQSIVDMHNGEMKIEVDGDLFKVTVKVSVS